jgi:hypothetical protein
MLSEDIEKCALIGEYKIVQAFLLSALDRDEGSASRPSCFIPGQVSVWIGGWLGPRVGLNDVEKVKSLYL